MSERAEGAHSTTAICYCTDKGYLLPSIVSANSLIKNASTDDFDIYIFTIDVPESVLDEVRASPYCARIRFVPIERKWRGAYDPKLYDNRIPDSTIGRLTIHHYLDRTYDKMVYIDGDTFVFGDIAPLIGGAFPRGRIGAVDDAVEFSRAAPGPYGAFNRRYLSGIGIPASEHYFNAGVIIADGETWKKVSDEAYAFFLQNVEKCACHDQSALNWAARGRKVRLSLRWNSISAYTERGLTRLVQPVIRHYTGRAKPWATPADRDLVYKDAYNAIKASFPSFRNDPVKPYVPDRKSPAARILGKLMIPIWQLRFFVYERGARL